MGTPAYSWRHLFLPAAIDRGKKADQKRAERLGNWDEAAKRLVAGKFKDPALGSVLFQAGKLFTIIPIRIC